MPLLACFVLLNNNTISWYSLRYKNGSEVFNTGRTRIKTDGGVSKLTIYDLHEKDSGDVSCELSNSCGRECSRIHLAVDGRARFVCLFMIVLLFPFLCDDFYVQYLYYQFL